MDLAILKSNRWSLANKDEPIGSPKVSRTMHSGIEEILLKECREVPRFVSVPLESGQYSEVKKGVHS